VVNLGIGMPEGVAAVAAEEKVLKYLTLREHAKSWGDQAASGSAWSSFAGRKPG
jgi:propionate CoA-transferase